MIKKEKIFELKIEEDDDVSGIDSISLVDEPAIEVMWVAFKKEQEDFYIPDNEDELYLNKILGLGQSESDLVAEGWEVYKIDNVSKEDFFTSDPNEPSSLDNKNFLTRFKYAKNPDAPGSIVKDTTRQFCRELISADLVFRKEDINFPNDFGSSCLKWRGGFNCRHLWQRILYKRNADIGTASSTKGRVNIGPSYTIPGRKQQPNTTVAANPSFAKEKLDIEPNPCWEGYEPIGLKEDGSPNCVPIKEKMQNPNVSDLPPYVDELPKKKKKKKSYLDEFEYLLSNQDFKKQYFASDDEKHIVLGPAMIPDMKIFRKDSLGNPYYVYFSSDTIKMIASKYMKNKYTDNNDMMHDGEAVPDVYVMESWIKESNNDKSTDYGFKDLPVGTWFVSMKINNPEIWSKVKDHQLNGFSVSGYFEEVAEFKKEELFLYKVAEILKNIKD